MATWQTVLAGLLTTTLWSLVEILSNSCLYGNVWMIGALQHKMWTKLPVLGKDLNCFTPFIRFLHHHVKVANDIHGVFSS